MELNEVENDHQNATTSLKVVMLIFALVLTGALWYLVYYQNTAADFIDNDSGVLTTPITTVVDKSYQKSAELSAVGNYTGEGQATAKYDAEKGEFTLTLKATLDDPAEGKFYEGWLVRGTTGDDNFKAVSAGRLTKNEDGSWSVTFTAPVDYPKFLEIVITEETETSGLDNQPETHVLEGKLS